MGFLDSIAGAITLRYKGDIEDAKAKIRTLSAEQKKAAREQIEAMENATQHTERLQQRQAAALAIVGSAAAITMSGYKALREDARLSAGAAGVDLDRLSEAYEGLKTRTELLTLAQAGSRGGWKLTTGQIGFVIGGMRALEAQGFETDKVFSRFVDNLSKGSLEGLDDFGLTIESTGDKAQDLQLLLQALRAEVLEVGGNFELAGDNIARSMVTAQDAIGDVRIAVGKLSQEAATAAGQLGRNLAFAVGGPLETAGNQELAVQQYQDAILARRFTRGRSLRSSDGVVGQLLQEGAYSTAGVSDAEIARALAEAQQADALRRNLRRIKTTTQLDVELAKLPSDWREIDPGLTDQVERYREEIEASTVQLAKDSIASIGASVRAQIDRERAKTRRGGGGGARRGSRGAGAQGDTFVDDLINFGARVYEGATQQYEEEQARARAGLVGDGQAITVSGDAIGADIAAALAGAQQLQAALLAFNEREKSFLASAFGELWEFDAYTEALTFLGGTVQSVTGQMFDAFAQGEELSAKMLRRLIGQEIAAEGKRLWARGTSGMLTGLFHLVTGDPRGPGMISASAAMLAGAAAIGTVARGMLGGGGEAMPSVGGSGGGGRQAANTDPGAAGGGGPTMIVLSSAFAEQSPRQRAQQVHRALESARTYAPPEGVR